MPELFNVLMVDDEAGVLEISKLFLERKGAIRVDTAISATDALEKLKNNSYDAVVADYLMPGIDGIEFLKILRERSIDIPFILFTRKERNAVVIEALHSGADYYIQKGIDVEPQFAELEHIISSAIRHKRAEQDLNQSEERFRAIFESAPIGILSFKKDGDCTQANPAFFRILGIPDRGTTKELNLFRLGIITPPLAKDLGQGRAISLIHSVPWEDIIPAFMLGPKGKDPLHLDIHIAPLLHQKKEHDGGYIALFIDITEQVASKAALFEAQERYHALFENATDPTFITDMAGKVIEVNLVAEQTLRYSRDQIMQMNSNELEDASFIVDRAAWLNNLKENGKAMYETMFLLGDGKIMPVEVSGRIILYRDSPSILFTARDITDRKKYEKKLKASLKEKEVLLKEVHHRVKNNMQVISSLIHLQSGLIKDPEAVEQFSQCERRVRSMSLVHEALYQSKDLAFISASHYVRKLGSDILGYSHLAGDISVEYHTGDIDIDLNTAIPLGLILNELVTNSLKYAFAGKEKGTITITFEKTGEKELMLVVQDDGIGLPESFDIESQDTLGMQLVNVLSGQLDGTIRIDRAGGARFEIRFPWKHG
jgi:PAS domain S-box-containing protein